MYQVNTTIALPNIQQAIFGISHIVITERMIKAFPADGIGQSKAKPRYTIRLNKWNRWIIHSDSKTLLAELMKNPTTREI
jgi:hypothetical protein